MITHTALFKFNDDTSTQQIGELMAALMGLKDAAPGIERIVWGENFSDRSDGHTHVVSISFSDRAALKAFYDHTAHKNVGATLLKPITANLLLVDYEERSA